VTHVQLTCSNISFESALKHVICEILGANVEKSTRVLTKRMKQEKINPARNEKLEKNYYRRKTYAQSHINNDRGQVTGDARCVECCLVDSECQVSWGFARC